MAMRIRVEKFEGKFKSKNTPGRILPVSVTDVVRAAVTVGGPVKGTSWRRSQRRVAIAGTVLSALVGKTREQPLRTTSLYKRLETTEKSGVSFRLGMAFAAIAAERILDVRLLEHLNHSNSALFPSGGKRRADLFGFDAHRDCHVVEAKASTYGPAQDLADHAKSQAQNVRVIGTTGGPYKPRTRSASITDLSVSPVSVLLVDPPETPRFEAAYKVDIERLIEAHYSPVRDLLALGDEQQAPPLDLGADTVGGYLPGTEIWLGVNRSLYGQSHLSWQERVDRHAAEVSMAEKSNLQDTVSAGRDGHVLQLGPELSRIYESWQERDDVEEG
jgi:hypothetical protein